MSSLATSQKSRRRKKRTDLDSSLNQCLANHAQLQFTAAHWEGHGRFAVIQGRGLNRRQQRAMSEPLTDQTLVEHAKRGDEIAFSELVTRHYRRALRVGQTIDLSARIETERRRLVVLKGEASLADTGEPVADTTASFMLD